MRYSLYSITDKGIEIDRDLSLDDIDILLSIVNNNPNFESTTYGIVPEVEYGDRVINIKTKDIGEVYYIDNSIKYIDENNNKELVNICGYVNIINSSHEMAMWKVSDLIVIDDSTIN